MFALFRPDKKHLLYRLLHTRMNRSLVEWATIDEGNPKEPKTQRSTVSKLCFELFPQPLYFTDLVLSD